LRYANVFRRLYFIGRKGFAASYAAATTTTTPSRAPDIDHARPSGPTLVQTFSPLAAGYYNNPSVVWRSEVKHIGPKRLRHPARVFPPATPLDIPIPTYSLFTIYTHTLINKIQMRQFHFYGTSASMPLYSSPTTLDQFLTLSLPENMHNILQYSALLLSNAKPNRQNNSL